MGLCALFRLLWRRLSIGHLAMVGLMIAWSLFSYHNARFMLDYPRPRGLDLFVLVSSALVGHFFVGQSVAEVQHTLLSWTLPDFRRRLVASALFLGVVTALPVSALYAWLGGAAPWFPVFTSALLWYGMGILIAAGDVRDDSERPRRPQLAATLAIAALFAAGAIIGRIADFYSAQPILCALLTLAGASLCLFRVFNVNAARQKSLAPSVFNSLGAGRLSERAVPARARTRKRSWRLEGPLTGAFNWIRAGEHENFARIRGGWAAGAVRFSAIAALIVAALPHLAGSPELLFLKGFERVGPFVPLFLAIGYCVSGSFFLQKGWLYPLSRSQLAGLAYWSSLLYNASICGIMAITFALIESAGAFNEPYDFVRPVALVFVFCPFMQWLRLRHGPHFLQNPGVFLRFSVGALGVVGLGMGWFRLAADSGVSQVWEAAAGVGLILLSQVLYRCRVAARFRTSDLV